MKILVAATESGGDQEEQNDIDDKIDNNAQQKIESLNHKAFKTVSLFKSTAVLSIYELAHQSFTQTLGQVTGQIDEAQVCTETKLLIDVLKIYKLNLSHGKNQMQFKIKLKEHAQEI